MRLAFALLLAGLSSRLFALVLGEASLVLLLACYFDAADSLSAMAIA